jgi:hypothetical protein
VADSNTRQSECFLKILQNFNDLLRVQTGLCRHVSFSAKSPINVKVNLKRQPNILPYMRQQQQKPYTTHTGLRQNKFRARTLGISAAAEIAGNGDIRPF